MESLFSGLIGIVLLIHHFISGYSPVQIKGIAMHPTLKQDQFYFTQKISTNTPITRGDIVIYTHTARSGSEIDYVKRVIGLPGETLMMNDGKVFINGTLLMEEYVTGNASITQVDAMQEIPGIIIPENHYFLMGDNRSRSDDSRAHGTIPREQITKKIGACYKGCD